MEGACPVSTAEYHPSPSFPFQVIAKSRRIEYGSVFACLHGRRLETDEGRGMKDSHPSSAAPQVPWITSARPYLAPSVGLHAPSDVPTRLKMDRTWGHVDAGMRGWMWGGRCGMGGGARSGGWDDGWVWMYEWMGGWMMDGWMDDGWVWLYGWVDGGCGDG
jgi:hypothetical protein